MNILVVNTQSQIIFIGVISIFLELLCTASASILIDHIDFTTIDDRDRNIILLHTDLFIANFSLNWHGFTLELSQLNRSFLASSPFIAWLLGHINYLLLNDVRLFVFILQLFQLLIRNFSFSLFLFKSGNL